MKKILIIILLALVGSGLYFYFENHRNVPVYDISEITKELSDHGKDLVAKPKVNFADLMGSIDRQEKIECDYKVIDDDTKQPLKAKIYISARTFQININRTL